MIPNLHKTFYYKKSTVFLFVTDVNTICQYHFPKVCFLRSILSRHGEYVTLRIASYNLHFYSDTALNYYLGSSLLSTLIKNLNYCHTLKDLSSNFSNFKRFGQHEGLNHVNISNIFVYLLKIFEKRTRGNAAKLTKMSTDKIETSTCRSLGQYQGPQAKKIFLPMSFTAESDLTLIRNNT